MDTRMMTTSMRLEKMTIKGGMGMQPDPALCEVVSNPNPSPSPCCSQSMLSIPESGDVDNMSVLKDENRSDSIERRETPADPWRHSGDWDDTASVSSNRSYATCDTAATSESVQSIIQRLNSETDRRRRRLRRRRSMRSGRSKKEERDQQEPSSPRGFTVEVVERNHF